MRDEPGLRTPHLRAPRLGTGEGAGVVAGAGEVAGVVDGVVAGVVAGVEPDKPTVAISIVFSIVGGVTAAEPLISDSDTSIVDRSNTWSVDNVLSVVLISRRFDWRVVLNGELVVGSPRRETNVPLESDRKEENKRNKPMIMTLANTMLAVLRPPCGMLTVGLERARIFQ